MLCKPHGNDWTHRVKVIRAQNKHYVNIKCCYYKQYHLHLQSFVFSNLKADKKWSM